MTVETLDFTKLVQLMRQMAHDMRGPLGVLSVTADMFAQGGYGELNPKQERAAKRMQRASNRALALLDDFMIYIKAEAHQLPLDINAFDPQALLAGVRETVSPEAKAKGLTVRLTGSSESLPPALYGDATLIQRIVLALLWNAVVFSDQGEITLQSRWDSASSAWTIEVSDEGSGIAPEHVPHIFEPLWRGPDCPQSPSSGYGMGLAMAQALTRMMDGQLTLEKTGPKGSVFCLHLPLCNDRAETFDKPQTTRDPLTT
jgi:signal transduction histidine kinase